MNRSFGLVIASVCLLRLGATVSVQETAPVAGGARAESSSSVDDAQSTQTSRPRTQLPSFVAKSYFSLNVGYFGNPFSTLNLAQGFQAAAVERSHTAVGVVLVGYRFNEWLSGQIGYLHPLQYVSFQNVNRTRQNYSVSTHLGEFTLRSRVPVDPRLAIYGEAGLATVSRSGFGIGDAIAIEDTNFVKPLLGAGLEYHVNPSWDVVASLAYVPASRHHNQPHTLFLSGGFKHNMRPLPDATVRANAEAGFVFPAHVIQIGHTTNAFGYGPNNLLSKRVPIFWGGKIQVARGTSAHYQQNVFHTRKVFSLDVGASVAHWKSDEIRQRFFTISLYPLFRFTVVRAKAADWFVTYSLAGPSFISQKVIDNRQAGTNRFTFQDFIGTGIFAGRRRNIMASVTLNHYSNGNIFTKNAGVKIPLTFNVGYAF